MKIPGPDHPITIEPSGQKVTVTFNGKVIAESSDALRMQESTYPAAYYIPLADIDPDVIAKTDHSTHCPYKGDASYYSVTVGIEGAENAIWTYEAPYDAVAAIKDHAAFYVEKMDSVTVS